MKHERRAWFLVGLFSTALATLALETLATRLLSVLTWYHLSFFAVSLAMLGMAAGAVQVQLGQANDDADAAARALARDSTRFALSIPLCYLLTVSLPIRAEMDTNSVIALAFTLLALGVPFYFSGLVVSLALTRIPGRVGLVYAVDLLGAALGSLLVLLLLSLGTMTTAVFVCGIVAALGAVAFRYFATGSLRGLAAYVAIALAVLSVANAYSRAPVRIVYSKGKTHLARGVWQEKWSIHGQVRVMRPTLERPWYWGAGKGAPESRVESAFVVIDGAAGTAITRWDGKLPSLSWTQYDVTALVYHLRPAARVGIIGMGGGRDVLSALASEAKSVTAVEVNRAFFDLIERDARDFARIAGDRRVRLVHDEGRSYFTRTPETFDVLQMSLVDTWAATGAGAFTLSENGLYTLEAWATFLERLSPRGVLSVSRWFSAAAASETSRLVSLATASLLERGVTEPSRHMLLVALENVATLLVSPTPFDRGDLEKVREVTQVLGFSVLLQPGAPPAVESIGRIAASRSSADLERAVAGEPYDYSPPRDDRPYFFNLLRVGDFSRMLQKTKNDGVDGGVVAGNLGASRTLAALLVLVLVAVVVVILAPLQHSGLPAMAAGPFAASVGYFSLIGAGFMFVQIGLMQRLSVYLGHPTYAVAVTLFGMITATGMGSLCSERVELGARARVVAWLALGTALAVTVATLLLQPLIAGTIRQNLLVRSALTLSLVLPVSFALGAFFPWGMRLLRGLGGRGEPWMWGVNGASGVLAGVVSVVVSIGAGIRTTLLLGACCYALLAIPAWLLARARGRPGAPGSVPEPAPPA